MLADRRNRALVALVIADAALKVCAWLFLRGRAPFAVVGSALGLGYLENDSGFGYGQTQLLRMAGFETDDSFVLCSLAVFLLLALVVHLWHRIKARGWLKTVGALAAYAAAAYAALSLAGTFEVALGRSLRAAARAAGPLAVAVVLYAEVRDPYYRLCSLFLLAGNLGNCASLLLPPHSVIDYFGMYRPAIDGYVYANAADAYLAAAIVMLAFVPARAAALAFRARKAVRGPEGVDAKAASHNASAEGRD